MEAFFMFFQYKMQYLVVSKKKNPLLLLGWDWKIRPWRSPFVITRQASWCQSVIFWTDFSIHTLTLMMDFYMLFWFIFVSFQRDWILTLSLLFTTKNVFCHLLLYFWKFKKCVDPDLTVNMEQSDLCLYCLPQLYSCKSKLVFYQSVKLLQTLIADDIFSCVGCQLVLKDFFPWGCGFYLKSKPF